MVGKKSHASVLRLNDQQKKRKSVCVCVGACVSAHPFGTCRRLSAYRRANGQPIGHGGFSLNLNEGASVTDKVWWACWS